jgi:hypothetical protein
LNKELAAANAEMGKGDMRKACQHYFNAQKMSGARCAHLGGQVRA